MGLRVEIEQNENGEWPISNEAYAAVEDALIRTTGQASMRGIEVTIRTYLDAIWSAHDGGAG